MLTLACLCLGRVPWGPRTVRLHTFYLKRKQARGLARLRGLLAPGQIGSLVSWTRRFHEVVAGFSHPGHPVDAVPRRIQMMLDWIPLAAAAGDAGLRRLMSQGEPERSQAALNELIPRLQRIRLLLH